MVTRLIVIGGVSAPVIGVVGVVVCAGVGARADGAVAGGGGGGAPMWIVEKGDCVPSAACSLPLVTSTLESEGGTAASAHCTPSSSTSTMSGSCPLPVVMPTCFAITAHTTCAGTLTHSFGLSPAIISSLLSRHDISKSSHSLG